MTDLEYVLHLVQLQKQICVDERKRHKYPSHTYIEIRGAYGAYSTVETYINNLIEERKKGE